MMNVGLDHRRVDPQLGAVLQAERDRRLDHEVVDGLECRRRQPVEAAVERIMLGYPVTVEIRELTQRHAIGNPFAQLAIIPVLEPHQNQRAQHLSRRQAATAAAGLLQTAAEIALHPLDHVIVVVKECGYRLQQRLQAHALPHQFHIRKADLPRHRPCHGSALPALRCARALALQRLDVARAGLHQQVLQGTPVAHSAAHLAMLPPPAYVSNIHRTTAASGSLTMSAAGRSAVRRT